MDHQNNSSIHTRSWNPRGTGASAREHHQQHIHFHSRSGASHKHMPTTTEVYQPFDSVHQTALGTIREDEDRKIPFSMMEQYSMPATTGFHPSVQYEFTTGVTSPTYTAPAEQSWTSEIKYPHPSQMYYFGPASRTVGPRYHDSSIVETMLKTKSLEAHPPTPLEKHTVLPDSGLDDGLETTFAYPVHHSRQVTDEKKPPVRSLDQVQVFDHDYEERYASNGSTWNAVPHSQRVYTAWSGRIRTLGEAVAILNKVKWRPMDDQMDSTIPRTEAEKLKYVQQLYEALTDLSRFRDKLPGQSANKVNRLVAQRYTQDEIEARCFHVVEEVVSLHMVGSKVSQAIDPMFELASDAKGRHASDQALLPKQGQAAYQLKKKAVEDMNLSFAARMAAICKTVRGCKAAATDIMDGQKIYSIIHTPILAGVTKEDNRKNNAAKQKKIAKGKQKLEEERVSSIPPRALPSTIIPTTEGTFGASYTGVTDVTDSVKMGAKPTAYQEKEHLMARHWTAKRLGHDVEEPSQKRRKVHR